jgi:hypothetical protein
MRRLTSDSSESAAYTEGEMKRRDARPLTPVERKQKKKRQEARAKARAARELRERQEQIVHQLRVEIPRLEARYRATGSQRVLRQLYAKRRRLAGLVNHLRGAVVGQPSALRSGGVGVVRPGSHPRSVGDSTAVNRRHGSFSKGRKSR